MKKKYVAPRTGIIDLKLHDTILDVPITGGSWVAVDPLGKENIGFEPEDDESSYDLWGDDANEENF